jgi:molybdate transport system ATP-binding protein
VIQIHLRKTLTSVSGNLFLDVNFALEKGEFVAFYGPSGSGKTSILRMIAGLLPPDSGRIRVDDQTWYDPSARVNLKTQQRNFGIVFQDYGLFPNMTVRENISFALKNGHADNVDEMIALMELSNLENKKPDTLSGGQRQRVALARAIIRRPSILLLDEPFAALDTALRLRMQEFILKTHRELELTTILVSHDLLEVARLADRVFLLENGVIAKSGSPRDVMPMTQIETIMEAIARKYRE